jgi:hypothetical protein
VLSVLVVTASATGCDSGSSAGSLDWLSVASSADGTKLVATAVFGSLYTSTDSGATWTQRTQQGLVYVVSSADGTKLVGVGIDIQTGGSGFFIYTSSDSGATTVSCSRMADNATLALNSGLCFFRAFFFISFAFLVGSKLHLSPWSEFRGPLHSGIGDSIPYTTRRGRSCLRNISSRTQQENSETR